MKHGFCKEFTTLHTKRTFVFRGTLNQAIMRESPVIFMQSTLQMIKVWPQSLIRFAFYSGVILFVPFLLIKALRRFFRDPLLFNAYPSVRNRFLISLLSSKLAKGEEKEIVYSYPILWGWIGHIQSILSTRRSSPSFSYKLETFSFKQAHVDSEQFMHIDWLRNKEKAPIVILIPGIAGNSNDGYVRCFAAHCHAQGMQIAVMNRPGCGYDSNTKNYYPIKCHRLHFVGHYNDIEVTVNHVHKKYPNNKLFAAGFSLGGNNLMRYLGHAGSRTPITAAVAICPPYNLAECERMLSHEQKMYALVLTARLKEVIAAHKNLFSTIKEIDLKSVLCATTLSEFDSKFTVQLHSNNMKDIYNDYYLPNCCSEHIDKISVPVLCINAKDDAIVPERQIPYELYKKNENIIIATTKRGGHLGFFEGNFIRPSRYGAFTDRVAVSFFESVDEYNNPTHFY